VACLEVKLSGMPLDLRGIEGVFITNINLTRTTTVVVVVVVIIIIIIIIITNVTLPLLCVMSLVHLYFVENLLNAFLVLFPDIF
jgi:hypothetical protein